MGITHTASKMVSGTLYTYPGNYRAQKALIAAAYSGANVTVHPNFEFGKTNTDGEFLKKFPLGKVPAFEDSNGVCLSESNAIAYYVADETLRGKNVIDQSLVRQYVEFAENEILPSACTWVFPTLGFKQYNKQDTDRAQTHIKKCMSLLNEFLESRTFLVGERVTLADISLCCNMMMLYAQVLDPKFREPYVNVNRWFMTCINQPNFKKVIGDFKVCEKMATFDNKRYQELHPKDNKKSAPKESKPKQEKKQDKPKEDKPKEEAAPAPVKKEKKDYFADVPETAFVIDEWKRMYSNADSEDDFKAAYKWLFDNFDAKAWSFWYCNYKYNSDNKVDFKTGNAIGGFYQRLDGCRKQLFGTMLYWPQDGIFPLSGVWLQKGAEKLIFSLNPDWNVDAENYDFKKLDPTVEADKKLIISYFHWEGDCFPKGVELDGDCFK